VAGTRSRPPVVIVVGVVMVRVDCH
jgi:hypothetical protein